jgi:simple sugar transport system permease protein
MFSYQLTLNVWAGVAVSLVVTLALGFLNGLIYVKTGLPSFIVTLGTFFMLAGLNLGFTKLITHNVATPSIEDMDGFSQARAVFARNFTVGGVQVNITVLWWIVFVAIATWLLLRTRSGNWIFAVGGSASSARAVGVPVTRTKIALFMGVSFTAWFYGMHILFNFKSVQSGEGVGNEFFYIICAVVGGCLLTGGYGSAIGAAIGAFIWGMTSNGIVYAEWNPDWFKFFLGAMLLAATVVNLVVRRRAEAGK